ncbi:hypothetical protein [Methylobacterium haplocladii]|uniref:Uncharacterized protein n=1 Tax=Methylobacterium haplocladii TaxID=1176176 RepID=A0A512IK95_9HYPH|nr:hypothetical protein [Methylobacterium haplocladii]GEO98140.1 hypothetical protein MHA02_05280 [Methylobacterium haplocladii]GJD83614.1 hypothetical protein HPGCJGGD_1484 [Methylobacterium haplocladii]GLS60341.1 hypothetical protein GCM10007887_30200 [Methylobacterium haplocladii]
MTSAHTPMPGEDSGALPEDRRDGEIDPAAEVEIEANPQPEPDSSLPPDDDPDVEDTEQQPS